MSDVAIRVEGLGKQYRLGGPQERYSTLRDQIGKWTTLRGLFRRVARTEHRPPFWALKDVSFEVQPGEVVGIIGRNGAGKSTLLKILSRITEPTEGEVDIHGRVVSLLEVGTGFHPELTGRENAYLNGAILGMRRAEITRKFDEIVAFAEVEKFIDTPVKHYSSGMYIRLAFAVAAHLEPEILIVDEVLAVGDAAFQDKCLGKMQDVASRGRTVLLVSHNMPTIRRLTQRCVYMSSGRVVCVNRTPQSIDQYLSDIFAQNTQSKQVKSLDSFRRATMYESSVRIQRIETLTANRERIDTIPSGNTFCLDVTIDANETHERACLSFCISNERGERVSTFFSGDAGFWFPIRQGRQTISCTVRELPLSPGRYTITVGLNRTANTLAFDVLLDYPAFMVVLPGLESGGVDWPDRPWGAVHWEQTEWSIS